MKKINILIVLLLLITINGFVFNSCTKFLDLQEDPDVPGTEEITEKVIFPAVCSKWLQSVSETTSVLLTWHLQQTLNTKSPTGQDIGQLTPEVTNQYFGAYSNILFQAKDLYRISTKNRNTHYQGIAELLMAYGWSTVTDFFGKAPYTEAFRFPEIYHPVYDDQSTIYSGIEQLLNDAIIHLSDKTPQALIGNEDLIFGGDVSKWLKLAYSFKARYAMRLSYAPGKTKSDQASIVLAALANGMSSNSDNATMVHFEGAGERGWVYQGQLSLDHGLIATNHLVNLLESLNDPRLPVYLTKDYSGGYSGLVMGNLYTEATLPSFISRATYIYPSMPTVFMTYSECKFLEAEANIFKGNFKAAKTAFEKAVDADMKSLIIIIPQETIDEYLRQFDFANDEETAQEIIITQKYLANFHETNEIHFDKIRTGYPIYNYSLNYNLPGTISIPRKFPYPQSEINTNKNVPIYGGKPQTNRVWWDAKAITNEMH
jgi:hypothetical protein